MAREIERSTIRVCILVTKEERLALQYYQQKLQKNLSDLIRDSITKYLKLPKNGNEK